MKIEDFSGEIDTIKDGITGAQDVLEAIQNEVVFGDESLSLQVDRVLSKLGEAESELEYIENNLPDSTDELVDQDEVVRILEDAVTDIKYLS